jgi:predicted transcriptional regulator
METDLAKPKDFLVSVRPQYAMKILDGEKTVELRRRFPDSHSVGATVFLYSSSPICALVGRAKIRDVQKLSVSELWKEHADAACISRKDFYRYFSGVKFGFAIMLGAVKAMTRVTASRCSFANLDRPATTVPCRAGGLPWCSSLQTPASAYRRPLAQILARRMGPSLPLHLQPELNQVADCFRARYRVLSSLFIDHRIFKCRALKVRSIGQRPASIWTSRQSLSLTVPALLIGRKMGPFSMPAASSANLGGMGFENSNDFMSSALSAARRTVQWSKLRNT